MKDPKKFPKVLGGVMIIITVIFLSAGALSYAAFGSKTKTVVLLNMPQDNKFVNGVQFIYSLAILLSTPLQIYPAIEITSQQLFSRTGKYNPYVKWKKNFFRFFVVLVCACLAWAGAGDLDKFVSLVGSFACIPLVFIYPVRISPASCQLTANEIQPLLHYRAVARTTTARVLDVTLCIIGAVGMVYTTTLTIQSWIHGGGPKAPGYCDGR
jgi:proton-coupled amino acid transporter